MKPTKEIINKINEDLINGNSVKKKSAIRKVGKHSLNDFSELLFTIYENLKKTNKNWEIQSELIKSLGILREKRILETVKQIVFKNVDEDMITYESTKAYLRIKCTNKSEIVTESFNLLSFGGKSVRDGVIAFLGIEKIRFNKSQIKDLINIVEKYKFDKDLDCREILISTMANWSKEDCKQYIGKYIGDNRINQAVIKSSLKGKRCHLDY